MEKSEEYIDRSWKPEFKAYTEFIVSHPNYTGLYYERDEVGRIKWVVTGKSANGQKRQAWWDKKCIELGIPIQRGCYAKAARIIHPTKKHVCQCCGRTLSILYEYPGKRLLEKINSTFNLQLSQIDYTIGEIIEEFCTSQGKVDKMSELLNMVEGLTKAQLKEKVYRTLVSQCSNLFSPGVMSNPPDRFDGYHSDGLCCREKTDKGRHTDNMATYTQDRRAYEEWADGDYNLANRLMGEFKKAKACKCPVCGKLRKMSADHRGPISLGFCHSAFFAPMCKECNSSKNNRFTLSDVKALINLEENGHQVISWHAKPIWELVKPYIKTDKDAKKASSVMAACHQNVLNLLAKIYFAAGEDYLSRYLHPEYSLVDYRFENFDPLNLEKLHIISKPLDSKNKRKNQERYERVAFESLSQFAEKDNRRNVSYLAEYKKEIRKIIGLVKKAKYHQADILLNKLIGNLSEKIFRAEWNS